MIIQLDEAKRSLLALQEAVTELASALKITDLREQAQALETQTADPDFWSGKVNTAEVLQKLKGCNDKIAAYEQLASDTNDALDITEMAIEEEDESVTDEVLASVKDI